MEEPEVELPLLVSEIYSSVGITFPSCMFCNMYVYEYKHVCTYGHIYLCIYACECEYVCISVKNPVPGEQYMFVLLPCLLLTRAPKSYLWVIIVINN